MSLTLELISQLHAWLAEDDEAFELHALLELPEPAWVRIVQFKDAGETLQVRYQKLSMTGSLLGDVELVCSPEALKAARRQPRIRFDSLDEFFVKEGNEEPPFEEPASLQGAGAQATRRVGLDIVA